MLMFAGLVGLVVAASLVDALSVQEESPELPSEEPSGADIQSDAPDIGIDNSPLSHVFDGTDEKDSLTGTDAPDHIAGYGDDDTLAGGAGNDDLDGMAGDDLLAGEDGSDQLYGADGNDSIAGGGDDDTLAGQTGDDFLAGEGGDDALVGGMGHDVLAGGSGNDGLQGGADNDVLAGGEGIDTLMGDGGDDHLSDRDAPGVFVQDFLNGGAGDDTLVAGEADWLNGGAGADDFVISQWLDQADKAVTIGDYDPGEDQLVVVYDATLHPDPHVIVEPADGDWGEVNIFLDGTHIASVMGDPDLSLADLRLLPLDQQQAA